MRREFVFDDGGMNLLSSSALRSIRAALPSDGSLFVFRSARPGLFAAGADMAEMARFTPFEAYDFAQLGQSLFDEIASLPMVTVAIIDGDCFGGALDLALSFDLRFATPRSRFSHPGARIGIVTGFGGTSRWRESLSHPTARRLFLGNEVLSAADALSAGLVDRVADSFDDELARLEALPIGRTRAIKELARHAPRLSSSELLRLGELLADLYEG
ncbi:MAG: enoyl-CoA hydratase/isomerase family protein [Acidobacteria bacterium]|nr:enoyl-CoA hydratase/isomerase family protein [Acidobacteriota bacterium]